MNMFELVWDRSDFQQSSVLVIPKFSLVTV